MIAIENIAVSALSIRASIGNRPILHGVTLPLALADLGLIDEYEFVVHPVLAGHGPTLLAGLRERIRLELVERHEFASGAVVQRYRPVGATGLLG